MCLTAQSGVSPARSLRARRSQLRASPRDPFLRKNAIHVWASDHSEDSRPPPQPANRVGLNLGFLQCGAMDIRLLSLGLFVVTKSLQVENFCHLCNYVIC